MFDSGSIHELASGRSWDRARLWREVSSRTRRNLAIRLNPGDRVLLLASNTPEFFAELLAVWMNGAVAVPVDAGLTDFELANLARAADPRLIVITGNGNAPNRAGVPTISTAESGTWDTDGWDTDRWDPDDAPSSRLRLDDDALILFTSGSTGQPKGVVHTHRSLWAQWHSLRQALGTADYQRTLCMLPVYFGHGLICNCLFPLLSGCDLFLGPAFTPDAVTQLGQWIDQHHITAMSSVPTLWRLALSIARPPRGDSLQRVHCGSAPLGSDLWRRIGEWAASARVINTYGITETASWLAGSLGDTEPEDGLIGHGWGAELRIGRLADVCPSIANACPSGESGYVWTHTAKLMKGYYQRDDLTDAVVSGGWFFTGDMGRIDERGRLILEGRAVDEINKGGLKIQPQDVETAADGYPHLRDVCAFAVADEFYGQNVGIALVWNETAPEMPGALRLWMEARLSKHKMPSVWYQVEALPRTARGKIQRKAVAELCAGRRSIDPVVMNSASPAGGSSCTESRKS